MKTIDEIRAELEAELRLRKDEIALVTAALAALDGVTVAAEWALPPAMEDDAYLPPKKASDVQVPDAEAQRVHDAIDDELHRGEPRRKGRKRQGLTAAARDAIVKIGKKSGDVTVEAVKTEMDCSLTWARVQLRLAEEKGIVEQVGETQPGRTVVFRYVVPSAQAAARVRLETKRKVLREGSAPVPGTGRTSSDSKYRREVAKAAKAAGVPVSNTKSGHMIVGETGSSVAVSKSNSGRRGANVAAAIKRQAS
jgi:hypothetical protein